MLNYAADEKRSLQIIFFHYFSQLLKIMPTISKLETHATRHRRLNKDLPNQPLCGLWNFISEYVINNPDDETSLAEMAKTIAKVITIIILIFIPNILKRNTKNCHRRKSTGWARKRS